MASLQFTEGHAPTGPGAMVNREIICSVVGARRAQLVYGDRCSACGGPAIVSGPLATCPSCGSADFLAPLVKPNHYACVNPDCSANPLPSRLQQAIRDEANRDSGDEDREPCRCDDGAPLGGCPIHTGPADTDSHASHAACRSRGDGGCYVGPDTDPYPPAGFVVVSRAGRACAADCSCPQFRLDGPSDTTGLPLCHCGHGPGAHGLDVDTLYPDRNAVRERVSAAIESVYAGYSHLVVSGDESPEQFILRGQSEERITALICSWLEQNRK